MPRELKSDYCQICGIELLHHPSCPACGLLVGREHMMAELVKSDFYEDKVCSQCHREKRLATQPA